MESVTPSKSTSIPPIFPAVAGAINCLFIGGILVAAATVLAVASSMVVTSALCFLAVPFLVAAFLCAVYAICKGRVKQGVTLVAVVSVLSTLPAVAIFLSTAKTAATSVTTPLMVSPEDLEKQLEQLQKLLEQ